MKITYMLPHQIIYTYMLILYKIIQNVLLIVFLNKIINIYLTLSNIKSNNIYWSASKIPWLYINIKIIFNFILKIINNFNWVDISK